MAKTMGTHFAQGSGSGQPQSYIGGAAGSITIDNNMPNHGSGVASVVVGDFSRYLVHDAGLRFERSDERFFDSDQVGFRAAWRLDGRCSTAGAFVKYLASAN